MANEFWKKNCNSVLLKDLEAIVWGFCGWDELSGKTILITGGTGFIGSLLAKALLLANDELGLKIGVVISVRDSRKAETVYNDLINRDDITIIPDSSINTPCDYIVHTACPTTSKFFVNNPVETIDCSVFGTREVLDLAKKNNVQKMVYLSSMEEYGVPYEANQVMTEDKVGIIDHLNVRSSYSESKRLCELYCRSFYEEYGVNVVIARLAQTFGAGVNVNDNRVFMQFAKSVIKIEDIILHTEGKSMSNFCYSTDAVVGILTLLVKGNNGEAYNICNDRETRTIAEIAHMVADDVADGDIQVLFDIPKSDKTYGYAPSVQMKLCSDKLKQFGWIANCSMKQAYENLVKYLAEECVC